LIIFSEYLGTIAWYILWFLVEKTASKYGCHLKIYRINSSRQLKIYGFPAQELGLALTTIHCTLALFVL
jgi:hypothetical protein